MIEIKDLHKSYKTGASSLHVLKGINFSVKEGELVSIMGSSGSGKSTLLNILGMLDEADEGTYTLDNFPIKNLNEKVAAKYRNKFLGFIFQSFNLINYKSALDNVALPLYYQGVGRKERMDKSFAYLEKVGLADWAHHLPNELSGGQKQSVAIARALVHDPAILLLDEPTSSMDNASEEAFKANLRKEAKGKTMLVVTHRTSLLSLVDRIIVMDGGKVVADGPRDTVVEALRKGQIGRAS